jgi:hypothetical protein
MPKVRTADATRATGESAFFNLYVLRRLFNSENIGRGTVGERSRFEMHPTITWATYWALTRVVPVGRGQYGSPVLELALRLLLATGIGSIKIATVAEELNRSLLKRKDFIARLRQLADAMESD